MAQEFVYIPVPEKWVSAIYERLVELANGSVNAPQLVEPVVLDEELLRRMYDESLEQHRRLMKYLASRPDEWLSTSEIADALKLAKGSRGLAGMLGAFARRANHRYGGLAPWTSTWDAAREESMHLMSSEVAAVIQSLV